MRNSPRILAIIALIAVIAPTQAAAQNSNKYTFGIRSGLITGTMTLSGLAPDFADLEPDGPTGPHMSGFFLTYKVRNNLRIGIETLVANSDQNAATSMNYQAAGPVVELSYGKTWFVSGGLHMGGLIVNAMTRQGAAPATGASTGSFYKGNGLFVAPSVDVGYRFRRTELSLYAKQVNISGETQRGGISDFSSTFAGLRFAIGL
jgi:hypothetical protein